MIVVELCDYMDLLNRVFREEMMGGVEHLDPDLLDELNEKKIIYRTLPTQTMGLLGVGTYPKDISDAGIKATCLTPLHKQHEYSGIYVLRGTGVYRDERGYEVAVKAGDFIHRVPRVRNLLIPDAGSDWLEVFVAMPKIQWDSWSAAIPGGDDASSFLVWEIGLHSRIVNEFISLQSELSASLRSDIPKISLKIQDLLFQIWRLTKVQNNDMINILDIACRRLEGNLCESIDLEQLASDLGLGYGTFRRKFRQEIGMGPAAYRNKVRLERSCEILSHGKSVSEVALTLGYNDVFAFSRQFKKAFGIAPSQFRMNY